VFLQDGGFEGAPVPIVPGHEAAGLVDAVGEGVDDLEPGQRVALYYLAPNGEDRWTEAGLLNRSPSVRRMGVDVDGAFAEYVVRPRASVIVPSGSLPATELAVLTDAVATPLHALRRIARVEPDEIVAVIGVGGIGSNAVQLAKAYGATVIAVSRTTGKLELAQRLGADEALVADDSLSERLRGLTEGNGADVVLQCADSAAAYETALELAAPGGRIVLVGSSSTPFHVHPMRMIWAELSLLGSRGFLPEDIEEAIDLRLAGRISVDHLVEQLRPLGEAQAALDDLRHGRTLRTVLVP
jgi:D-arabinose 1-dehydrogenase-like Zn-dependent alcohol dehydrogenase